MTYLFIMLVIVFNLYIVQNIKAPYFYQKIFIWLPAFFAFFIPMALQDNVGTDYNSYKSMYYYSISDFNLYVVKGEFFLIEIIKFARYLNDPQFIFVIFSFFISIFFFYNLFLLEKLKYKAWLVFIIYFLVTGLYQTSFNVLRQALVFSFLPCIIYFIVNKKFLKFGVLFFLLSFIHKTVVVYSFLIILINKIPSKSKVLYIFIFSIPFYSLINQKLVIDFILKNKYVSLFLGNYGDYLGTDYFSSGALLPILTKLYVVPIFIVFWYFYLKDKKEDKYFDFIIFIWSLTYFMFLQMLYIQIYFRIWNMFSLLCVFPIYYVFLSFYRKNIFLFALLFLYIFLPFFMKVLVFPEAEYEYKIINYLF